MCTEGCIVVDEKENGQKEREGDRRRDLVWENVGGEASRPLVSLPIGNATLGERHLAPLPVSQCNDN